MQKKKGRTISVKITKDEVEGRIKRVPDLRVDDYFAEWN